MTFQRTLHWALALLLFSLLALGFTPKSQAHHQKDRRCDQHWWQGVWHRRKMMRCEEQRLDPPGGFGYILGVAECESGEDLMDTDKSDGHAGPLQQATRYWPGRFRVFTHPSDGRLHNDPANFRSNVLVSFRQARADGTWQTAWACA